MFRERLALLLEGKNQSELGRAIGLKPATVNRWVRGSRLPDLVTLAALARHLSTSADYLLGLSDDPRPREPSPGLEHVVEVLVRTRNDQIEEATVRRVRRGGDTDEH